MNRLAAIRNEPRAPQAPAIAPPHRSRLGYGLIAAACLFWGFSASLGRAAFTGRLLPGSAISRLNPTILSQARATFSFLALFAVLAAIRGIRSLRLPWTAVGRMFLLGVVGVAPSNYFYYLAIQRTNVATAIILQYTAPVWVLIYMVARGREKLELARFISVLLAIAGIALVLGVLGRGRLHFDKLGVLAALIAAFSFAFYNVYGHCLLGHYDRWTVLLYTTCSASVLWGMVHPPRATV
ncbi:MAG: DMT family transporter, partial [Deltaproteobacteria bacterium]|nr:DMT family transporter [Deltaproteobacteria bacterium]